MTRSQPRLWIVLGLSVAWPAISAPAADPVSPLQIASPTPSQTLSRIAFGSCAKQDRPQPVWNAIVETDPQLFLFIGDNIYGDTEDMDVLRAKWALLGGQPGYQMLKQNCPVWATWDDHDYGANDAGREYAKKRESQQIFLEFFEEPRQSPRWNREGLYDAKIFGPEGRRVQVILLDTRYFRSPLVKQKVIAEPGEGLHGTYTINDAPGATMLGAAQWRWLEEQLRLPAELRVIASSIQLISNEHGWEKWGTLPRERQRMLDLVRNTQVGGVIFLSGDRHSAEISRLDLGAGRLLYDVTSSSLNAPSKWRNELNPHRMGQLYHDVNFGTILIDWNESDPVVRMQVRDLDGKVVLQCRETLSALRPTVATE